MALFKRSKKEEKPVEVSAQGGSALGRKAMKAEKTAPAKQAVTTTTNIPSNFAHVLRRPRITEKVSDLQARGIYTFDIAEDTSKRQIIDAVRALYKVVPRKVAVVRIPSKTRRSMRTGKSGVKKGGRKAYVYLKAGETISIH